MPFCSGTARDFELPGRSEAFGMRVMAATSHPFGQVEVLTNIIDHGMGIQAAIDAPRIFPLGDTLQVESTVSPAVIAGLSMLGHHVVRAENPLGTAQAIWIDWEAGLLRGGADGRRDGLAAGW